MTSSTIPWKQWALILKTNAPITKELLSKQKDKRTEHLSNLQKLHKLETMPIEKHTEATLEEIRILDRAVQEHINTRLDTAATAYARCLEKHALLDKVTNDLQG